MENISLIVGVVGAVPALYALVQYIFDFMPVRRFLCLGKKSKIDVILSTSSTVLSRKGAKVQRATTGIGQVQGVSHFARFVGKIYKNKKIEIHLGNNIPEIRNSDLVLLGGPAKNEYSAKYIKILSREFPQLKLCVDDNNSTLSLCGKTYNEAMLDIEKGTPSKDYGLVVVWDNPFSSDPKKYRSIYCSGLTSYGTGGASLWIFNDILTKKSGFHNLRKVSGRRRANFLAVIEMEMVNKSVVGMKVVEMVKL